MRRLAYSRTNDISCQTFPWLSLMMMMIGKRKEIKERFDLETVTKSEEHGLKRTEAFKMYIKIQL